MSDVLQLDLLEEAEKYFYLKSEVEIENNEQFEGISENLKKAKSLRKEIDARRKEEKKPFMDQAKKVENRYKPTLDKLDNSIKMIEADLKLWIQKEEARKRKAEQEAKKKAEEQERKIKEQLEKTKKEAEQSGDTDFAKSLETQIANVKVEAPKVVSEIENINGQHTRKVWKGKLVDINKVPKKYLKEFFKLDQTALNQFARKNENKVEIAGIEFYEETSIVNR